MKKFYLALLAASALAGGSGVASAQIVVDGSLDAGYGGPTATVGYNAAAPTSNFGAPTNESSATSYSIYGTVADGNVYGFFQADPNEMGEASAGAFVNLYLDTDPDANPGSDLGFEITSDRAFVPGVPGYSAPLGLSFYAMGNVVEFAIPLNLLQDGIASLPGFTALVPDGGRFTFRLSQSLGYSVAGGATYGDARLGSFNAPTGAVPEPATWAMMIGGFGLVGGAMRRRRSTVRAVTA